jgi:hypothetical protein
VPYSFEKEYMMRYNIAKKMTNNFKVFNEKVNEYKLKAKEFIENTKKSKEFIEFCKHVHSEPFKLDFIKLLKESKQDYLITPELKKYITSTKKKIK